MKAVEQKKQRTTTEPHYVCKPPDQHPLIGPSVLGPFGKHDWFGRERGVHTSALYVWRIRKVVRVQAPPEQRHMELFWNACLSLEGLGICTEQRPLSVRRNNEAATLA